MFEEKTLNAYKSVKAPDKLKQRVMDLEKIEPQKHSFTVRYRAIASIAACFLLVCIVLLSVVLKSDNLSVSIDGENIETSPVMVTSPYAVARYSGDVGNNDLNIALDFNVNKSTEITVSDGYLVKLDESTESRVNKDKSLILKAESTVYWTIENPPLELSPVMTVKNRGEELTFAISYNESEGIWKISKTNE